MTTTSASGISSSSSLTARHVPTSCECIVGPTLDPKTPFIPKTNVKYYLSQFNLTLKQSQLSADEWVQDQLLTYLSLCCMDSGSSPHLTIIDSQAFIKLTDTPLQWNSKTIKLNETKYKNWFQKSILLIPIHYGAHWSLAVFFSTASSSTSSSSSTPLFDFILFDSLQSTVDKPITDRLKTFHCLLVNSGDVGSIVGLDKDKKSIRVMKLLDQQNTKDCGIWVLIWIRFICSYVSNDKKNLRSLQQIADNLIRDSKITFSSSSSTLSAADMFRKDYRENLQPTLLELINQKEATKKHSSDDSPPLIPSSQPFPKSSTTTATDSLPIPRAPSTPSSSVRTASDLDDELEAALGVTKLPTPPLLPLPPTSSSSSLPPRQLYLSVLPVFPLLSPPPVQVPTSSPSSSSSSSSSSATSPSPSPPSNSMSQHVEQQTEAAASQGDSNGYPYPSKGDGEDSSDDPLPRSPTEEEEEEEGEEEPPPLSVPLFLSPSDSVPNVSDVSKAVAAATDAAFSVSSTQTTVVVETPARNSKRRRVTTKRSTTKNIANKGRGGTKKRKADSEVVAASGVEFEAEREEEKDEDEKEVLDDGANSKMEVEEVGEFEDDEAAAAKPPAERGRKKGKVVDGSKQTAQEASYISRFQKAASKLWTELGVAVVYGVKPTRPRLSGLDGSFRFRYFPDDGEPNFTQDCEIEKAQEAVLNSLQLLSDKVEADSELKQVIHEKDAVIHEKDEEIERLKKEQEEKEEQMERVRQEKDAEIEALKRALLNSSNH